MADGFADCRSHLNDLRRTILRKPRAYPGLCALFLLPPVNERSEFGIVVLEQGAFTPMTRSGKRSAGPAMLRVRSTRQRSP
jgi:proline racemase